MTQIVGETLDPPAAQQGAGEERESVVIRFAGDSGDGMQLTGSLFTHTAALVGNDLATLPDFPAEIRAPAGTLAGVSGFQLQFGSTKIFTPGDAPDVLVAMNPAALKRNTDALERGATIVVNVDAFTERALSRVGYDVNPLEDDSLSAFQVLEVKLSSMTIDAVEHVGLGRSDAERCKNFFALGLVYWMYGRPLKHTLDWIAGKFAKTPEYVEANQAALKAGYHYGETAEIFAHTYRVPAAQIEPGLYRKVTGNEATVMGFVTASQLSGLNLFLGSYPITPASDILHGLSNYKEYGVRTFQAEDEIAAVSAAIGAAFGGSLGLTTTSGPGVSLKGEAIGLATMIELPLIIANIQRAGPSTGMPTKTEQADLLQAVYGRHGESPTPVVAPASPTECFHMAIEAARLAITYMTPVMFLSDGYIANGAEPWLVPDPEDLEPIEVEFHTEVEGFHPYMRDPETLARPWVRPGTPGLEHRIGGLEKEALSGDVSYDPHNHEHMIKTRAEKIARMANSIPDAEVFGEEEGELLLIGWGGTFGALRAATMQAQRRGMKVSHMHLRYLNPLPRNVGPTLKRFTHVVVAELNNGQLRRLMRDEFLVDIQGLNKIQGLPFKVSEIMARIDELLA